jgi:Type IV secretory pathway, VirJ component
MILKRFKSVVVRLGASLLALVVMVSAQGAAQTPRIVTADDLSRLPLTEMPAQPDTGNTVAIFLTGDGGWATLDKQVVSEMRAHGIAL